MSANDNGTPPGVRPVDPNNLHPAIQLGIRTMQLAIDMMEQCPDGVMAFQLESPRYTVTVGPRERVIRPPAGLIVPAH